MKPFTYKALPAALSALLLAASPALLAAQPSSQMQDRRDSAFGQAGQQAQQQAERTNEGNAQVRTQTLQRQVTQRDMRVSKLIGAEVQDPNAQKIGTVKDLVVDTRDGSVSQVVLSAGGFLGIGNKLTAVPADKIAGLASEDKLVLDMPKSQLQSFPQFDDGHWPDWNAQAGMTQSQQQQVGQSQPQARYRRASNLLDAKLVTPQGKDTGEVKDMVVGLGDGKIRYGVAQFDGGKGGDKLVVVPVQAVHADGNGNLVLAANQDELRNAPTFEKSQWPDVNDRSFRQKVDQYANSNSSWQTRDGESANPIVRSSSQQ